jgi:hypothetical protein
LRSEKEIREQLDKINNYYERKGKYLIGDEYLSLFIEIKVLEWVLQENDK